MGSPAVTALTQRLLPLVGSSKSRTETLAMLTPGMISARTVNLAHLAPERGLAGVIAGLSGGPRKRVLALDRTNWKVGEREVNILVLAAVPPRCKVPLMWTVLAS